MEQNPNKTGTPQAPVMAQVVAVDGVAVAVGQPVQPQAAAVGVPYGGYDTTDQPQREQSKFDQVRDFCNREWFRIGPCRFTTKILFIMVATFLGVLLVILQITGVIKAGEGGGGGGGGGGSFIAGTRVKLEDGTWQCIEQIRIGDRLAIGGRVTARMEFESDMDDLFSYPLNSTSTQQVPLSQVATDDAIIVAGAHAVLENREWRRVRSSTKAKLVDSQLFQSLLLGGDDAVRVFDIDVERHRIVVRPGIPSRKEASIPCIPLTLTDNTSVIFADFSEVDVDHKAVQQFEAELLNTLQQSQYSAIEL